MLSAKSQEAVDTIINARIAVFAGIICSGDEELVESAAFQLALIGTKISADTLMCLIEQAEKSEARDMMICLLITYSLFREDYLERLIAASGDAEGIREAYLQVECCDQRLIGPPLWQTIAEALDALSTKELRGMQQIMIQNEILPID